MDPRKRTAQRLAAALGATLALFGRPALAQSAGSPVAGSPDAWGQAAAQAPVARPAPYAGNGPPTRYSGMQVYDRYGGEIRRGSPAPARGYAPAQAYAQAYPQAYAPVPAPRAVAGPTLNWSGKVEASAPVQRPAAYAYAPGRAAYAPAAYASPVQAGQAQVQYPAQASAPPQAAGGDAAPRGWTFVAPIGAAPADLPRSIYDRPAAPAPAPASSAAYASLSPPTPRAAPAAAAPTETGPHHYSVHSDYGIQPDPIPLPPQFFGATADLSQPATDEPIRRATSASGKAQNPLQPAGGE